MVLVIFITSEPKAALCNLRAAFERQERLLVLRYPKAFKGTYFSAKHSTLPSFIEM